MQLRRMYVNLLFLIAFIGFPLAAHAQQTCTAPPSGLVAWWPGNGNANDIIGGNNGTLVGGVTFASGEVQQAFSFSGGSVVVPNQSAIDITGDLTIEAWVSPASAARGYIVLKGNGNDFVNAYSLRYGAGDDQSLLLSVADGPTGTQASYFLSPTGVVPIGTFSHIAVTIQGTTVQFYVNGIAVGGQYLEGVGSSSQETISPATQLTATRSSDQGSFTIGSGNTSPLPFAGLIDEVSLYNRALSASEIQAIFNAGTAGKCKYAAQVQPPINADGSSVFRANRGVVPVKFTLTLGGVSTCQLPPATIAVFRTAGGSVGSVNESDFIMPSDNGLDFRIDSASCQYIYNLDARSLGPGTYQVQILIGNSSVGSATFGLQ